MSGDLGEFARKDMVRKLMGAREDWKNRKAERMGWRGKRGLKKYLEGCDLVGTRGTLGTGNKFFVNTKVEAGKVVSRENQWCETYGQWGAHWGRGRTIESKTGWGGGGY